MSVYSKVFGAIFWTSGGGSVIWSLIEVHPGLEVAHFFLGPGGGTSIRAWDKEEKWILSGGVLPDCVRPRSPLPLTGPCPGHRTTSGRGEQGGMSGALKRYMPLYILTAWRKLVRPSWAVKR